MKRTRIPYKEQVYDEDTRRELIINSIVAIQNREGIPTTREQAEEAYDNMKRKREVET